MEEQAHGRKAHQNEAEASEMRQQNLCLGQQQADAMDAQQQLLYECQVHQSCGMQRALERRLLAEQNFQA
eukprot:12900393-Prorocentrum_lima.AAC.1